MMLNQHHHNGKTCSSVTLKRIILKCPRIPINSMTAGMLQDLNLMNKGRKLTLWLPPPLDEETLPFPTAEQREESTTEQREEAPPDPAPAPPSPVPPDPAPEPSPKAADKEPRQSKRQRKVPERFTFNKAHDHHTVKKFMKAMMTACGVLNDNTQKFNACHAHVLAFDPTAGILTNSNALEPDFSQGIHACSRQERRMLTLLEQWKP